jgi:hypothetical protein
MPSDTIDYLTEDIEIPNQKFCLMSFLEKKNDFNIDDSKYNMSSLSTINEILKDGNCDEIDITNLNDDYTVLNKLILCLLEDTKKKYITGVKCRGVFKELEDAKATAAKLHDIETNTSIWVGEIGKWLPFNPNSDAIEEQVYNNAKLNNVMKGYFENQAKAKYFFEKRNQELIKQNIEENEIKKINNLKSREDDTETNLNDQTEIISDVNNSEDNSEDNSETIPDIFSDNIVINK